MIACGFCAGVLRLQTTYFILFVGRFVNKTEALKNAQVASNKRDWLLTEDFASGRIYFSLSHQLVDEAAFDSADDFESSVLRS